MAHLFPELDVERIRYRTGCRLPPNRFKADGNILAMTFGYSIYWRGELDEDKPRDVVNLIHEVLHVDQVRRYGGEQEFACAYGKGYVEGGGQLPASHRPPDRLSPQPAGGGGLHVRGPLPGRQGACRGQPHPLAGRPTTTTRIGRRRAR